MGRSRSGGWRSQGSGSILCRETDGPPEGKGGAVGGGGLAKCQFTGGMGGWYNRGTGSKIFSSITGYEKRKNRLTAK